MLDGETWTETEVPAETRTQPLGPNQERWLRALESGEYQQGTGRLVQVQGGVLYCCLGVGEVVVVGTRTEQMLDPGQQEDTLHASPRLMQMLALRDMTGMPRLGRDHHSLVNLNDSGHTLRQIAEIIRQDPSVYFTEPR